MVTATTTTDEKRRLPTIELEVRALLEDPALFALDDDDLRAYLLILAWIDAEWKDRVPSGESLQTVPELDADELPGFIAHRLRLLRQSNLIAVRDGKVTVLNRRHLHFVVDEETENG